MPDQLFEGFTDHMSAPTPLPPSEVRRRGDRRRRRTQVAVGVAGVAAAAAVITPVLALSGGSDPARNAPIATEGPSTPARVVTTIADDFPLDAGMGGESGVPAKVYPYQPDLGDGLLSLHICTGPAGDNLAWDASQASDALVATWSNPAENSGGEARTLATYPDEATASSLVSEISATVAACTKPGLGQIGPYPVAAPAPDLGDEAVAYVDTYLDEDSGYPTGEGTLYVVVREGNALVLLQSYFGGAGDPAVVQEMVDLKQRQLADTVDAMASTYGG
ncbi:MAG TPA: hypothetical protein VGE38_15520 [Nocardioides sp.]|uniref:hypothetical protein n=1 Tax=Nocardioides sp. TaxID=35761 RepID=UPI002ED7A73D